MLDLIVAFLTTLVPDHSANGLASTAPSYLTRDQAREHLGAAVVAAAVTNTDLPILLSIAWHESRYKHDVVTPEPGGRFSCGVMTPEPIRDHKACSLARSSLVESYLAGARHLKVWLRSCGGHYGCALRGYAGAATHDCRESTRACIAARDFAQRATWIRFAIGARRELKPAS
jgi:hypothetical protein